LVSRPADAVLQRTVIPCQSCDFAGKVRDDETLSPTRETAALPKQDFARLALVEGRLRALPLLTQRECVLGGTGFWRPAHLLRRG